MSAAMVKLFRFLPFYHERAAEEIIAEHEATAILTARLEVQQRQIADKIDGVRLLLRARFRGGQT